MPPSFPLHGRNTNMCIVVNLLLKLIRVKNDKNFPFKLHFLLQGENQDLQPGLQNVVVIRPWLCYTYAYSHGHLQLSFCKLIFFILSLI